MNHRECEASAAPPPDDHRRKILLDGLEAEWSTVEQLGTDAREDFLSRALSQAVDAPEDEFDTLVQFHLEKKMPLIEAERRAWEQEQKARDRRREERRGKDQLADLEAEWSVVEPLGPDAQEDFLKRVLDRASDVGEDEFDALVQFHDEKAKLFLDAYQRALEQEREAEDHRRDELMRTLEAEWATRQNHAARRGLLEQVLQDAVEEDEMYVANFFVMRKDIHLWHTWAEPLQEWESVRAQQELDRMDEIRAEEDARYAQLEESNARSRERSMRDRESLRRINERKIASYESRAAEEKDPEEAENLRSLAAWRRETTEEQADWDRALDEEMRVWEEERAAEDRAEEEWFAAEEPRGLSSEAAEERAEAEQEKAESERRATEERAEAERVAAEERRWEEDEERLRCEQERDAELRALREQAKHKQEVLAGIVAIAAAAVLAVLLVKAFHLTMASSILWGIPVLVVGFFVYNRLASRE